MKILITGSTGFVGKRLVQYLHLHTQHHLLLAVHKKTPSYIAEQLRVSYISLSHTQYSHCDLKDIDIIIHLAAFVPTTDTPNVRLTSEMNEINVESTLALARQAVSCGVGRFIYLSTLKVNGESTAIGHPFKADSMVKPETPYGVSKYQAEEGLLALAASGALEVVIIRPPLIYGPDVKGNFYQMMRFLKGLKPGFPLPLGGLDKNRRSYLFIDNLIDLVNVCIDSKLAANQIFLVSDGEDVSTTALIQLLLQYLNKQQRLWAFPPWVLKNIALLTGKTSQVRRLCDSLCVDMQKTKELLGWYPKINLHEGLRQMVESYVTKNDH